jgi:two-component system nitrate/nitrite response regulator NarP
MSRILVFTNQPIVAAGFRQLLAASGLQLAAVCGHSEQLRDYFNATQPEMAVLDVAPLPQFEVVLDLRRGYPQCKMVLWAEKLFLELAFRAMECGVHGILSSTLAPDLLVTSLHKIARGELEFHFPAAGARPLGFKRMALSRRERELLALVCQGLKNKEIATMMAITEGSVKVYLNRLFKRLGVKDRFELALYGLEEHNQSESGIPYGPWAQPDAPEYNSARTPAGHFQSKDETKPWNDVNGRA